MAPVDQLPEEVPKENEDTIPVGLTDGLAFKPIAPPKTKKRHGLRFLLLLLLLGGAGYAGWTVYGDRLEEKNTAGVPLIRADFGPIKTRPASPGGMEVPDRDKLVYDRISNSGDRTKVERLLPKSEEPKAPPVAVAAPGSVAPPPVTDRLHPVNTARKIPTQPSDIQSTVPTTEEVLSAAPPPPPPPPEPVKTAMKTPEVAPAAGTPDPSTAAGDTYQVQLAAARSRDLAEGEWKRLTGRHGDLLSQMSPVIVRADLGPEKGIYYRLRAGPAGDEAAARGLCAKLADRKVGCLVIKLSKDEQG